MASSSASASTRLDGAAQDDLDVGGQQRAQLVDLTAREQGRVDLEVGVLGRRADQRDEALLDGGQQRVLLGLVEAMDLVEEEDRRLGQLPAVLRALEHLAHLSAPGLDGAELLQGGMGGGGDDAGQRGLPGARAARRGSSSAAGPARWRRAAPSPRPSRCSWPTTSSSDRGRMRAASGRAKASAALRLGSASPASKSEFMLHILPRAPVDYVLFMFWCFTVAVAGGLVGLVLGNLRLPFTLLIASSAAAGTGANLLISAAAAGTAGIAHIRAGRINWRLFAWMAPPSIIAAIARRLPVGRAAALGAARRHRRRAALQLVRPRALDAAAARARRRHRARARHRGCGRRGRGHRAARRRRRAHPRLAAGARAAEDRRRAPGAGRGHEPRRRLLGRRLRGHRAPALRRRPTGSWPGSGRPRRSRGRSSARGSPGACRRSSSCGPSPPCSSWPASPRAWRPWRSLGRWPQISSARRPSSSSAWSAQHGQPAGRRAPGPGAARRPPTRGRLRGGAAGPHRGAPQPRRAPARERRRADAVPALARRHRARRPRRVAARPVVG